MNITFSDVKPAPAMICLKTPPAAPMNNTSKITVSLSVPVEHCMPVEQVRKTLLVIEKDAHTAYLLNYMLSREGYEVITSESCTTTRDMLRDMTPALAVFLDVCFLQNHDCSLIRTIRELSAWRHTPILLLAQQEEMDFVKSGLDAGATDFIIQPFNAAELLTQIERHAPRSRSA